jgi:hypothetical protein
MIDLLNLMNCAHIEIVKTREHFMNNLMNINTNFLNFNSRPLFLYIISMNDESIIKICARYFFDILDILQLQL